VEKEIGFKWANSFESYIKTMTWGHGYGGEAFWDEEEKWLQDFFKDKDIQKTLCACCGLFRESETLQKITSQDITALEYEKDFVEYLEQQSAENTKQTPHITITQGDVCNLKFNDNHFDLSVILYGTLGMLTDPVKTLQETYRVTKKSGFLVFTTWQDTDKVTQYRQKIYGGYKENRSTHIAYSESQKLQNIVIEENGKHRFSSAIFTIDAMNTLIKKALPQVKTQIVEKDYCRIFLIQK